MQDPDTFLCATLDIRSSELRSTSAGHPGPIYVPCSGGPATVDAPGSPVGLFPEASYEEHSLMLKVGDRVYFYSDGATDAVDSDGGDFGRRRLVEALDACRQVTLEDAPATVVRTIKDWAGPCGASRRSHLARDRKVVAKCSGLTARAAA